MIVLVAIRLHQSPAVCTKDAKLDIFSAAASQLLVSHGDLQPGIADWSLGPNLLLASPREAC